MLRKLLILNRVMLMKQGTQITYMLIKPYADETS